VNASGYRRWQCATCSDIYDEALGQPEYGIAPGTRFEDLPEDWVCPLCGTPKSDFAPLAD
jgi:rubredoxin